MSYQEDPLQWIASAGGPLILLPGEYLSDWTGVGLFDEQLDLEIMPPLQDTDYDRACAVEGYLGLLEVGSGHGLVLGDDPMSTAWWQHSPSEGILIRWMYGEDEAEWIAHLRAVEEHFWTPTGMSFLAGKEPVYLFDSSWPGEVITGGITLAGQDVSEWLILTLPEGTYGIDTGIARPNDHTELVVHRLRRKESLP